MEVRVGVIMGSKSDATVMEKAFVILDELRIGYESVVSSAHRNPDRTAAWAKGAAGRGLQVLIAGAGLSAALPGVIAAHSILPVIGVPIASGALNGVDSLYSIVQMPPGIPVATVALGAWGARNAALLAAQVLGLKYANIREAVEGYRQRLRER